MRKLVDILIESVIQRVGNRVQGNQIYLLEGSFG